jgi:hypothetical protein
LEWPPGLDPTEAPVYARNEIIIPATPEIVWQWLRRAQLWPAWYPNCTWLGIEAGSGPDLEPGTSFVWRTFGFVVRSTVRVFEPPRAIEWDASALLGTRAYHGWRIEREGERARVITEETQAGIGPWLGRWLLSRNLRRGHQLWVTHLRRVAVSGPPEATDLIRPG